MLAATGKKKISDLSGIGRKMPITMAVFTIGSLGLIGIPLFSGFIGKWYMLRGSLESGNILSVIVIILGSVLCAAYLLPIIRIAYFEPVTEEDLHDPGLSQKIALIILAAAVVILGIIPGPILELAKRAATELLMIQ
jgi:multicomponent Na+:H+ antiporter subunit D